MARLGRTSFSCIVAALVLVADPAGAQALASGYYHDDDDNRDGTPRDSKVMVDVLARVVERCGFSERPPTTSEPLDLSRSGAAAFEFKIDCNTPFAIGVASSNGAFLAERPAERGGFRTRLSYAVSLSVDTSGSPLLPEQCSSDSLAAASPRDGRCAFFGDDQVPGLSSGDRIAIEKAGRLTISWPDADEGGDRLAAGLLTDTVTITIGARS